MVICYLECKIYNLSLWLVRHQGESVRTFSSILAVAKCLSMRCAPSNNCSKFSNPMCKAIVSPIADHSEYLLRRRKSISNTVIFLCLIFHNLCNFIKNNLIHSSPFIKCPNPSILTPTFLQPNPKSRTCSPGKCRIEKRLFRWLTVRQNGDSHSQETWFC